MLLTLLNGHFTMEQVFAQILAVLLVIFLILPFHEWAHAFTASCLGDKGIKARGIETANVCLHVGAGTFLPVKSESISGHPMHREPFSVSLELLEELELLELLEVLGFSL